MKLLCVTLALGSASAVQHLQKRSSMNDLGSTDWYPDQGILGLQGMSVLIPSRESCAFLGNPEAGQRVSWDPECIQNNGGLGCISIAVPGAESIYNGCRYCEFDEFTSVKCHSEQDSQWTQDSWSQDSWSQDPSWTTQGTQFQQGINLGNTNFGTTNFDNNFGTTSFDNVNLDSNVGNTNFDTNFDTNFQQEGSLFQQPLSLGLPRGTRTSLLQRLGLARQGNLQSADVSRIDFIDDISPSSPLDLGSTPLGNIDLGTNFGQSGNIDFGGTVLSNLPNLERCAFLAKPGTGEYVTWDPECLNNGGHGCVSESVVQEHPMFNGCRYCEFDQYADVKCATPVADLMLMRGQHLYNMGARNIGSFMSSQGGAMFGQNSNMMSMMPRSRFYNSRSMMPSTPINLHKGSRRNLLGGGKHGHGGGGYGGGGVVVVGGYGGGLGGGYGGYRGGYGLGGYGGGYGLGGYGGGYGIGGYGGGYGIGGYGIGFRRGGYGRWGYGRGGFRRGGYGRWGGSYGRGGFRGGFRRGGFGRGGFGRGGFRGGRGGFGRGRRGGRGFRG